ncbi:membrane transporter [Neolentinus lepideus HHB14362 ss-1]|uniref:Membrane transporter n=1 Tax=Neolentinus lepideus HHB14362 ss-1 TaxID=1314782 RepID=A0A165PTG7_9AGAM|nr:membrane transporter [Neolentinus lepideus HHB14362 ss-1]
MQTLKILPTVLDFTKKSSRSASSSVLQYREDANATFGDLAEVARVEAIESSLAGNEPVDDPEFKLPKLRSLAIIILTNVLLQVSFFIIVSSSSEYAASLGGTATFAGLVIGIPTVFSGLTLLPLMKLDQGVYSRPLHLACAASVLGNMLYGLAYRARFLYLILVSRIVLGVSFAFWMYCKRYCSDPRIVGVRRRTSLAGWLVVGQGSGFSIGPFLGGLLYRIGFKNKVFNGYTSPGWLMSVAWLAFWVVVALLFEDVKATPPPPLSTDVELTDMTDTTTTPPPPSSRAPTRNEHRMTLQRWGVVVCMCWYAMTCFFILGAWEANIPIYTGAKFHYSPFAAGNLIALGGITTFPFLFANLFLARRVQDRHTLAIGSAVGLAGLLIMIALLQTDAMRFGTLYFCWFLVALGFNLASTVTLSLLSKQLPGEWNSRISLAIQYSNYTGRVTGAVWGGAGVRVGMRNYVGLQIAIIGIGGVMFMTLWRDMKAKTG